MSLSTRKLYDRRKVNINDPGELLAASQHLGVKPNEVAGAASLVGNDLDAIAAYLKV